MRSVFLLAGLWIVWATPLTAQVVPIGPFNGAFREGFETQSSAQSSPCVEERIFGDRADLCAPAGAPISISAGIPGGPQPHSGVQLFHTELFVEITFDQPARRFGGWFASTWVQGSGQAEFFDPGGALIGSQPFALAACSMTCPWTWNGWEIPGAGVSRIALSTPTALGGHFELDDLQLGFVCDGAAERYCTAKTNSLGCTPAISAAGQPSASASSGWIVSAGPVRNQQIGLLMYSLSGRAAIPYQGGWLCLAAPIQRTIAVASGGTALPAQDCSGVYALDLNAFAAGALGGAPKPELKQAGTLVDCQWWGRDVGFAPPSDTALSDALEYTVCP
jgi:hypothetical protein